MIREVRAVIGMLGTVTEQDILIETGLERWQVQAALEMLLRRRDVERVVADIGAGGAELPSHCRGCPVYGGCGGAHPTAVCAASGVAGAGVSGAGVSGAGAASVVLYRPVRGAV